MIVRFIWYFSANSLHYILISIFNFKKNIKNFKITMEKDSYDNICWLSFILSLGKFENIRGKFRGNIRKQRIEKNIK